MMTVPPHLTAYQGFDAFFHAAEGYLAKTANPMSDMFALQAIALIGKSLAAAVKDGSNADARADVHWRTRWQVLSKRCRAAAASMPSSMR